MLDKFQRDINYMRISLTDRCNLNCKYCRPLVQEKLRHEDVLSYEEILRFCQVAVKLGISKFKITGGEPLLRKDWASFIRRLKKLDGVEQVTLTTNGTLLGKYIQELKAIGIDGINISLDSCAPETYARITSCDCLREVLANIEAAYEAGLPIKINCVPLKGMGVAEILALLSLVKDKNIPLRFIELMPLECNQALQGLSGKEVREMLSAAGVVLEKNQQAFGNGPAEYYNAQGYAGVIGFIEPLHKKFCSTCNRVRLTATGMLRPCLYSQDGVDFRELLRSQGEEAVLLQALQEAIYHKPQGHAFEICPANFQMSQVGG